MISARENPFALQSGALAVLVHGVFFVVLLVSFSWKNVQTPQAVQVELWDSLPQPKPEPPPVVAPEPPPPPPPQEIKPEPEPEPQPEPKAEIQVKPKPPAPEVKKPPKEEPKKLDPAILKKQEEEKRRKEEERKLKELQKLMAEDLPPDEAPSVEKHDSAEARRASDLLNSAGSPNVNVDEINKYKGQIVAKIKRFVNKQLCGAGKPEIAFAIALMPTGEVSGNPRLTKTSGIPACDQAVERAIMQAQPLPLPPQPELFNEFRNLNLKFKPND